MKKLLVVAVLGIAATVAGCTPPKESPAPAPSQVAASEPAIHHVHFTIRSYDYLGNPIPYQVDGFVSGIGVDGKEAKYVPLDANGQPVKDAGGNLVYTPGPQPIVHHPVPYTWDMTFNADLIEGRVWVTADMPKGSKLTCDVTEDTPGGTVLIGSHDSVSAPVGNTGKTVANTVECAYP